MAVGIVVGIVVVVLAGLFFLRGGESAGFPSAVGQTLVYGGYLENGAKREISSPPSILFLHKIEEARGLAGSREQNKIISSTCRR